MAQRSGADLDRGPDVRDLPALAEALDALESHLTEVEDRDEDERVRTFGLLDAVDTVHRVAMARLGAVLGEAEVARLRDADPTLAWLLDAYGVGADEPAQARAALDEVGPYVESHGGHIELLGVADGVVRLHLAGACAGCSGSTATLTGPLEDALRRAMPSFARLEVTEDEAAAHAPPHPEVAAPGPGGDEGRETFVTLGPSRT